MELVLSEQPWLTSGLLGLVGGMMLFGWLQTGRKATLIFGTIVLAMIPLMFLIAANWQTDRELIGAAVYRTAQAVADNDFDAAVQVIEPSQRATIAAARSDLARFRFDEARVNKLRTIDIVPGSDPPVAEVDMSITVVVSDQRGQVRGQRILRRVILQFRKSPDGRWFVYDYNHLPIVGGPDSFSPQH